MKAIQLISVFLLGSLGFWLASTRESIAQAPTASATLSDLINADLPPAMPLEQAAVAESASDSIEPIPSQSALFGRLGPDRSKLPDDDFQFYAATAKLSEDRTRPRLLAESNESAGYLWSDEVFTWAAPNLFHQPLYFEEPNLERYGIGPHRILHAPISAAHFFTNIAVLPYHIASVPPRTRHYTLGHYRPGDRVPYRFHRAPFSVKGFAAQATAAAGIVLIP